MTAQSGAEMPKSVSESLGLFRGRLNPEGTPESQDDWWKVSDAESAHTAVADMIVQLDRAGWPVLEQMFTRDAFMARLQDGDLGMHRRSNSDVVFARAEALLLMDAGPSDALESRLSHALNNVTPYELEYAKRFDAWVRSEAAKA